MTVLSVPPRLHIVVDGEPLPAAAARAVGEVVVRQQLSQPANCEIQFFDLTQGLEIEPGMALQIGFDGNNEILFRGDVTGLRYRYGPDRGRVIALHAQDRLHHLQQRQPVRSHVHVTLTELARTLVADLGLQVRANEDGPQWAQWIQHRETDLELLQRLASQCGLYFTLRDDELVLLSLEGDGDEVTLSLGRELLEVEAALDSTAYCAEVNTLAWNPWRCEASPGGASSVRSGRQSGLADAAGNAGEDGVRTLASRAAQDASQADAAAQAALDRHGAAVLTLNGVASGNAALRPGVPLRVRDLAESLDGRYVLAATVHRFDRQRGYLTSFDTAPPPPPEQPAGVTQVTYGEVTRVDDPDRLGRIRVTLPLHGDVESDWLEVLLPAAGAGKGLIALPDVGDRVLLLMVAGDPAQSIVLGGLYGPDEPPDHGGVEGTEVRRYHFLTPGGQLLRLDDEARSARLESHGGNYLQLSPGYLRAGNSDGSFLEFTKQGVRLHAARDMKIEAPDSSIVISAQSIDFRRP